MKSRIQLVIPAAGLGSRFTKIGIKTPKPLIDVLGEPMLIRVIKNFSLTNEDKVLVICMKNDELPQRLSPLTDKLAPKVIYLEIDQLSEGPADTVAKSRHTLELDQPLIIANSDQYVSAGLPQFIDTLLSEKYDGTILTMKAHGNKWSYVLKNSEGYIIEVKEKLEISDEATVGIYGWLKASSFFESHDKQKRAEDKVNNEFYVAPTYNYLISEGANIIPVNIGAHGENVHGLGTPEDLNDFVQNASLKTYFQ
jgi:NDP-sugar pyrophosphorylase family protein